MMININALNENLSHELNAMHYFSMVSLISPHEYSTVQQAIKTINEINFRVQKKAASRFGRIAPISKIEINLNTETTGYIIENVST